MYLFLTIDTERQHVVLMATQNLWCIFLGSGLFLQCVYVFGQEALLTCFFNLSHTVTLYTNWVKQIRAVICSHHLSSIENVVILMMFAEIFKCFEMS